MYKRQLWQFVTAEQVEQITAQNMETAWNVARQGGYEDVSLLATQAVSYTHLDVYKRQA